jgi:predicted nucleic acid-binding protein
MKTAIDTNILSALWSREPTAAMIPLRLTEARDHGALLIGPVVYVELLAYPQATEHFVNGFPADTGITVDFDLKEPVWVDAGRRFARYAERRRKSGHAESKRLLADFLMGSHALLQADQVMSLDVSRYRVYYPELRLV